MAGRSSLPWETILAAARQHAATLSADDVGRLLPPALRTAWEGPGVTELTIYGPGIPLTVRQHGREHEVGAVLNEDEMATLLADLAGVPFPLPTRDAPIWEAAGPFGSVHAVHESMTVGGTLISLHRAPPRPAQGRDLVARGVLAEEAWDLIARAVRGGAGTLIIGPPGSSKTALLQALLGALSPVASVAIVEEHDELGQACPMAAVRTTLPQDMPLDADTSALLTACLHDALAVCPRYLALGELRNRAAWTALQGAHDHNAVFLATMASQGMPSAALRLVTLCGRAAPSIDRLAQVAAATFVLIVETGLLSSRSAGVRAVVRSVHELRDVVPSASGLLSFITHPLYSLEQATPARSHAPVRISAPTSWLQHMLAGDGGPPHHSER